MYKAYNHEKYKLPLIGDIVEKIVWKNIIKYYS
jgi:uncharacterized membrane protein